MSEQTDMNRGFLKDKLGNYQANPPEEVWDGISGHLGTGRRRRGLILLLATAASIALALSLGIHFFGPDILPQAASLEENPVKQEPSTVVPETGTETDSKRPVLELKVAETIATLAETRVVPAEGQPEESTGLAQAAELTEGPGQSGEPQLSLAMQSIEMAEQSEVLTKQEDQAEQGDQAEQDDPVIKLQEDELTDLANDPVILVETPKKRDPRWMLGAALSPLYSFRDADAAAIPENPGESGMLSYSTGVHVSYRRNSRLAIETGLYYNKTGIAIGSPGIQVFNQQFDNMVFGAGSERAEILTVSNSVGNIIAYSGDIYMNGYKINAENSGAAYATDALDNAQATESGIQQHLDYLELPFNLRYSVIDRTIEVQLVGGVSTNFLVDNYVTMEGPSGQEEIGYLENVNTVNYSGNAGLGMIYHMGKKLSLTLEPRFRYFLNSVNDSSLPSTRPYSMGFYTGLSYTF